MHNIVLPISVLSVILSVACLIALSVIAARRKKEIAFLHLLLDHTSDQMEKQAEKISNLFPCENESKNCGLQDVMPGCPGVYWSFCGAKLALSGNKLCPYILQNFPERSREKCPSEGRKDSD